MKLIDALSISRRASDLPGRPTTVFLACGFTPLHLQTLLRGYLQVASPRHRINVTHGLYGDLIGNLHRVEHGADGVAVVVEWSDIDARLGFRSQSTWDGAELNDLLESSCRQLDRIRKALERLTVHVALALPTSPLPVMTTYPARQLSVFEAQLRSVLASFTASVALQEHVRIASPQQLSTEDRISDRFDLRGEITMGFPYSAEYTRQLAQTLAALIAPPVRKKAIITDLDDTLWLGLVGEIGVSNVSWSLETGGQIHGIYQRLLASLASTGTLIGIASKNELEIVDEVLERPDILLPKKALYPIYATWRPKSESVRETLRVWNIAADSVVFIDDNPMEVAEVSAAFPEMECLPFPKKDYRAFLQFLSNLCNHFGTARVLKDDAIRVESVRANSVFQNLAQSSTNEMDDFLSTTSAEIHFVCGNTPGERELDLLNKTNQFNLNGRRISQVDWIRHAEQPGAFVLTATYRDRFGPLGTVAVLAGRITSGEVHLLHWAMSCRAFSRRIEHACVAWLFEHFRCSEVHLYFSETPRNQPMQLFLASYKESSSNIPIRLSREEFTNRCPTLFHSTQQTEKHLLRTTA